MIKRLIKTIAYNYKTLLKIIIAYQLIVFILSIGGLSTTFLGVIVILGGSFILLIDKNNKNN